MKLEGPIKLFVVNNGAETYCDVFTFTVDSMEDATAIADRIEQNFKDPRVFNDEVEALRLANARNIEIIRKFICPQEEEYMQEESKSTISLEDFPSKIVRFPSRNTIKLCRRRLTDNEGENCIFLTEEMTKKFIEECDCKYNYSIVRNKQAYKKWSFIMDEMVKIFQGED